MKFNEKYTEAEVKSLTSTMTMLALLNATGAPKTQEEFDNWCEETLAKERKEREAVEKAKATKAKKEAERAEAMGKTIEEYRAYKKAENNMKRHAREVERLERELAYHKVKVTEWKAKMN